MISSENELVALGRDNGVIRWVTQLPKYEDPDDRDDPIYWTGPVLAGNRLIAASSDGRVIEVDPVNGKPLREWGTNGSVRMAPLVAGGTLYLLSENGKLTAQMTQGGLIPQTPFRKVYTDIE
mgnify:CR=1 FL=1